MNSDRFERYSLTTEPTPIEWIRTETVDDVWYCIILTTDEAARAKHCEGSETVLFEY